jgi:hypothetical protein
MTSKKTIVLLLMALSLSGCMTLTITDSVLISSGITQDKPVRAGLSTTGEALGEIVKAAGWGGPVDAEALRGILEEYRKLRAQRNGTSAAPAAK